MAVPLLDLKAQNGALEAELREAFERVFRSGYYILGPEVEGLERELAEFTGAKHALGVSSGTDAISLALMALGIGPGDEVICPSFTFFATAGCVSRLGAKPVFVDSLDEDFNVDPDDIARHITSRTKAIIPVHLFGQMADMEAVMRVAKEHGLAVIEDAAQALGARQGGRQAGTVGTMGIYSFFPSKNLGGLGDSGAFVTNDDELAEKARILRVHGMEPKYFHPMIGANFRIDALQAAFLRVKLPHYGEYTRKRAANAEFYLKAFRAVPGLGVGSGGDGNILLPEVIEGRGHIWNQFTLRVKSENGSSTRRDALRDYLLGRGIGCEIYYPKPLHTQECFLGAGQEEASIPRAEKMAAEVLSLPVFPELTQEHRVEVVAGVTAFLADGW